MHGHLPYEYARNFIQTMPKTFTELKKAINRMTALQQANQQNKLRNNFGSRNIYQSSSFTQGHRNEQYPNRNNFAFRNNRNNFRDNRKNLPTKPCEYCQKNNRGDRYHWHNDCWFKPDNARTNVRPNYYRPRVNNQRQLPRAANVLEQNNQNSQNNLENNNQPLN